MLFIPLCKLQFFQNFSVIVKYSGSDLFVVVQLTLCMAFRLQCFNKHIIIKQQNHPFFAWVFLKINSIEIMKFCIYYEHIFP